MLPNLKGKVRLAPMLAMFAGLILFFLAGVCAGYMQSSFMPAPALPTAWQTVGVVVGVSLIAGLGALLIDRAVKAGEGL